MHGRELWRSDGTAAGAVLLADIVAGSTSSRVGGLTRAGDFVFFKADDGVHGAELWRTDGTAAGTVLVDDIEPGSVGSNPTDILAAGSSTQVVFAAHDRAAGDEVWTSDGTAAGTVRLSDLEAGPLDSTPRRFTRGGGQVFFVATTRPTGQELFVLPVAATGAAIVEVVGSGCAGSSGNVPTLGTSALPTVGDATLAFVGTQARPNAAAALNLSASFGEIPLPPCTAWLLDPYVTVPAATDVLGRATIAAPIPPTPVFHGLELYAQLSLFDQVGPRPITLSDAIRILIGR